MELCVDDIDAGLVEVTRREDADSAEELIERYGDDAYRLALRITGVRADAEEVVAQALLAAADRIGTFTSEAAIDRWICRAVIGAAYQKARIGGRHSSEIALADVLPSLDGDGRHFAPMDDWSKRLDVPTLQGGVRHTLCEALDALPPSYRTALVLHDVEGASKLDIAEILGVDVPAVRSHVHRARLFVRQRLSEYFT
jgi:RNA polymerase sigma-70 factor, ECF subfamily